MTLPTSHRGLGIPALLETLGSVPAKAGDGGAVEHLVPSNGLLGVLHGGLGGPAHPDEDTATLTAEGLSTATSPKLHPRKPCFNGISGWAQSGRWGHAEPHDLARYTKIEKVHGAPPRAPPGKGQFHQAAGEPRPLGTGHHVQQGINRTKP